MTIDEVDQEESVDKFVPSLMNSEISFRPQRRESLNIPYTTKKTEKLSVQV
jgi:hypothetical protein